MKYEPVKDHAERKRIFAMIEQCKKEQTMILIKNMGMPRRCYDCGLYKSLHMDSDGYGDNCDYCEALKRRFNENKLDIDPFREKLSDCPLIEITSDRKTEQTERPCDNCQEFVCDITNNSDMPEDWHRGMSVAISALYRVPSADRPQGEWISKHNGYWTCSECGLSFLFYAKGNYCPNCGARMKGADDE